LHDDSSPSSNNYTEHVTAASTGTTSPTVSLSPKPTPSLGAGQSLRLSASTLGGTSLSTIQRENQAQGDRGELTGSKMHSHTPRTPRNLLQSFLNIDTNRAAVLQLVRETHVCSMSLPYSDYVSSVPFSLCLCSSLSPSS
jgi:hypothetical protein